MRIFSLFLIYFFLRFCFVGRMQSMCDRWVESNHWFHQEMLVTRTSTESICKRWVKMNTRKKRYWQKSILSPNAIHTINGEHMVRLLPYCQLSIFRFFYSALVCMCICGAKLHKYSTLYFVVRYIRFLRNILIYYYRYLCLSNEISQPIQMTWNLHVFVYVCEQQFFSCALHVYSTFSYCLNGTATGATRRNNNNKSAPAKKNQTNRSSDLLTDCCCYCCCCRCCCCYFD